MEVCPTCAFTTIEDAVQQATANTTIIIYPGIYTTAYINVTQPLVFWALDTVTINGPGIWLSVRSPNLTTVGTFVLKNSAISVEKGGTWYQEGDISFYHDAASVYPPNYNEYCVIITDGSWVQNGNVSIALYRTGIRTWGTSASWTQSGVVHISTPIDIIYPSNGIDLWATKTLWIQHGDLFLSLSRGTGVHIREGSTEWVQNGKVDIAIDGRLAISTHGIFIEKPTVWTQVGQITMAIKCSPGVAAVAGIFFVPIGLSTVIAWHQSNTLNLNISATDCQAYGLWITRTNQGAGWIEWTQTGDVSIQVAGHGSSRATGK